MRIEIDDPAQEGRPTVLQDLPVSVGFENQGAYAEPLEEKVWLNGQPLIGRRALTHGDVLSTADLYIFVRSRAFGLSLLIDRQPGVVTEPPLLEPGESEEAFAPEAETQSIHRVAFKPLERGRSARGRRVHFRRLAILIVLAALAALLWLPKSAPPPPPPPTEGLAQTEVKNPEPAPEAPVPEPQADADKSSSDAKPASVEPEVRPKLPLGQVTVRGEPADAQVFVNGESKGAAGQTLALPATTLQLEVRRDGYQTFATSVTPQPGFPRVVEYKLLTPEQLQAERFAPVIQTKTGIELRLMPTGRFEMGSGRREAGSRANESRRTVTLQRRFYIGTKEVTNADYLRFRTEHLSGVIKDRSLDQDTHPVVNVSWRDAVEFCNWLSAQDGLTPAYEQQGENPSLVSPANTGYRLPTEAEWEWVARYERGQAARRYPWGQDLPVPPASGNYADRSSRVLLEAALEGYDDGFPTTAPVGRFPPNPLGLFDTGGNVSEWTHDFYTVYRELDQNSATDPTGPAAGTSHVIRGSNWKTANVTELRLPWREAAADKSQTIGFRIARYAE